MGKFDGILICTDLDGTLFQSGGTVVSEENTNAIRYFQKNGGTFTFITGRMPYFSEKAYNAIQPNAPFGCINGGGIYDHRTGQYVWTQPIPLSVLEMVRTVEEQMPDMGIQINCFEKLYFRKDNLAGEHFRKVTGLPLLLCSYEDIDKPFAKVVFCDHRPEEIERLAVLLHAHPLADQFDYIHSEKSLYEILPKGISKGGILPRLCEHLHLSKDKTIAVGDYYNDITMLRGAKVGIAVANACDAAKEAADYVTVSNDQHAIARIIEDIENGEIKL